MATRVAVIRTKLAVFISQGLAALQCQNTQVCDLPFLAVCLAYCVPGKGFAVCCMQKTSKQ